jgi:hypothetical protein
MSEISTMRRAKLRTFTFTNASIKISMRPFRVVIGVGEKCAPWRGVNHEKLATPAGKVEPKAMLRGVTRTGPARTCKMKAEAKLHAILTI